MLTFCAAPSNFLVAYAYIDVGLVGSRARSIRLGLVREAVTSGALSMASTSPFLT